MTMRNLLISTALIGAFSLTGCAAKTQHSGTALSGPISAGTESTPASSATSPASAPVTEAISEASIPDPSMQGQDASKGAAVAEHLDRAAGGLDTVYFDFDAYLLTAEARETLSRNAGLLGVSGATRVSLEGHADERGSDEYNLALAEQRGVAVRRYLVSLGIGEDRMEVVSYGEDKPAATGSDATAWAKNRRVELVIVK